MRKFIFNLHMYFAFIAGAFIIVFGITGSIIALSLVPCIVSPKG